MEVTTPNPVNDQEDCEDECLEPQLMVQASLPSAPLTDPLSTGSPTNHQIKAISRPAENLRLDNQCNCDLCGRVFSNIRYMDSHKLYACKLGPQLPKPEKGQKTGNKGYLDPLNLEENGTGNKKIFKCEKCGNVLASRKGLYNHKRHYCKFGERKKPTGKLTCEICGKTAENRSQLHWHKKKHYLEEKPEDNSEDHVEPDEQEEVSIEPIKVEMVCTEILEDKVNFILTNDA